MSDFYRHLGARFHEHGEQLEAAATVEGALEDAGLDPALSEKAWADDATADTVAAEHRELCERTRSFGVPTIVLDGGEGPAIFGPVITEVPDDDEAVELWQHVSWLVRHRSIRSEPVDGLQERLDRSAALQLVLHVHSSIDPAVKRRTK